MEETSSSIVLSPRIGLRNKYAVISLVTTRRHRVDDGDQNIIIYDKNNNNNNNNTVATEVPAMCQ